MKNVIYLVILLLVAASCQQKGPVVFMGTISPGSNDGFQLFIQEGEERVEVELDSTGRSFSLEIPCDSIQVVQFSGVVGHGDEAWPFSQTLLFKPGSKVHLELQCGERQLTIVTDPGDRDNGALVAYKTFETANSRRLWESPPKPENSQQVLDEVLLKKENVIKEFRPSEIVVRYLEIQCYLAYWQSINALRYMYSLEKSQLPEGLGKNIPTPDNVLNDEMAISFYHTIPVISSYLKKQAKTPEEQIRLAKELFTVKPIVDEVVTSILQDYVMRYNYAAEFDKGLERLRVMALELGDSGVRLVKEFESKKYSVEGAGLPDASIEDVDGNVYKLSDFKGKYLYIDLWASWCVPCCREVPFLQKLEKEVKNPQLRFISISLDENKEDWKKRMKELGMHGEQYVVIGKELTTMLNVTGIPHFLLYSKEGKLMQYKAERPSTGVPLKKMLNQLK